tara:strand:+ start:263 stop:535 length:273 start_codon:yes stop_codon:yes gene_type:complete
MSHRTLVLGAEAALPTTTGAASSFTEASVVRLVNTDTAAHLVSVVETQSGTAVGSFTMPAGSVEFLEKQYAYCIFAADAAVKGAKVGFTN